jgi:hypothetical protein
MATLTYVGSLVVTNCWCGIGHAVPKDLYRKAEQDHTFGIYCPLGHSWVFVGETEAQRLKRELKWADETVTAERARADQAEASRRAWKGQTTKLRNRITNGQCPFCGKYLVALDVHIARQHPDEKPRELIEADATS